jgi:PAS domain-containing protein
VAQHEIEIILTRELAGYLAMAIFVVDPAGSLIFYNEPAEALLGTRFEETGPMEMEDWAYVFDPRDQDGAPLEPESLPHVITLREGRPTHGLVSIRGLDGNRRHLEVTAIPLIGLGGRLPGAAAIFWEAGAE